MRIYKVNFNTTNALKDSIYSETKKHYIDVINGAIYVSERDLKYVMDNYPFISIEEQGLLYERPYKLEVEKKEGIEDVKN